MFVACRSAAGGASPQECAPAATELPASSTSIPLAGEYQLKLVATSGVKTGAAVEGTLRLQTQDEALRYRNRPGGSRDITVSYPFYGSTDVDLATVDAVLVGSTESTDPMQPGVLVMERRAAAGQPARSEMMIRLGSEANRRDRQRFDGGYMALRVLEASPKRVAGTWASGVMRERSAGYFCAVGKDGKDGKTGRTGRTGRMGRTGADDTAMSSRTQ